MRDTWAACAGGESTLRTGKAKIDDLQPLTGRVEDQIAWLDVAMGAPHIMHVSEGATNLGDEQRGLLLR